MSYHNPDQFTEPQAGLEPYTPNQPLSGATDVKGDYPTKEQEAVINQVADWIDADVIALVIAEELVDNETPVTLENCQKVWLAVLEDLHEEVRSAIPRDL